MLKDKLHQAQSKVWNWWLCGTWLEAAMSLLATCAMALFLGTGDASAATIATGTIYGGHIPGDFRAHGQSTGGDNNEAWAFDESVSGRIRGDRAKGSYRATAVFTDVATGARASCDSGPVSWSAVSAPKRVYAGLTQQNLPVVIERRKGTGQIGQVRMAWEYACTPSGDTFTMAAPLGPMRLDAGGRFGLTIDSAGIGMRLTGRVRGALASGTIDMRYEADDGDTCRSGVQPFTALSSTK